MICQNSLRGPTGQAHRQGLSFVRPTGSAASYCLDPERDALCAAADAVLYEEDDLRLAAVLTAEPRERLTDGHVLARGNDRRDREAPEPAGRRPSLDAEFVVAEIRQWPRQGGAAGDHVRMALELRAGLVSDRHFLRHPKSRAPRKTLGLSWMKLLS